MKKKDGGPAFPVPWDNKGTGMTLRDWFAGQALAGLLANANQEPWEVEVTKQAYDFADAMLAARDAAPEVPR